MFGFARVYKSYVYIILQTIKCVTALYLKPDIHTLIKKYFIAKKCSHVSLESYSSCNSNIKDQGSQITITIMKNFEIWCDLPKCNPGKSEQMPFGKWQVLTYLQSVKMSNYEAQ